VATRQVADLMSAQSVVPVPFAKGNVRILYGTEPREDFESIKVAELMRDATGAVVLNEGYVAPCLRVSAAPAILEGARKLLRVVLGKQRELAGARRHRDAASLEFTASDVTRYLQLNTLNGIIPVLNHIVDQGDLPPLDVYLLLVQVTGQLFTFGAEGDPTSLPKFQFTQLQKTFDELFARATALLRGMALEQCIPVRLEQKQGGLQVGRLEDERLARCGQFILSVKSLLPEQQVADQFPRLSKIASATEIHNIVQAAAPGVPLQVTFRPPPEVPVRPGVVYFSLSTQDAYWKNAVRDKSVAIYLPQALDPARTQLELLGVPSSP
jgi:type VI secretion system protein ImpJ